MKITFIYSSRSGNTKKLAQGLHSACDLDKEIYAIEDQFECNADIHIVCCWIDKAKPDSKTMALVESLKNTKTYIVATLGAKPDSEHGVNCKDNIREIFSQTEIIGIDLVQGAISDDMIEMFKKVPSDHIHALSEEKLKRYESLRGRPNKEDIDNAFANMIKNIEKVK